MFWLLIAILGGAVGLSLLIATVVYKNIIEMSKIDHLPEIENDNILESEINQWAASHGFHYMNTFLMQITNTRTFVAVWQHPHDPTFFAAYICQGTGGNSSDQSNVVTQKTVFDFITYFDKGYSLTTGSTSDGNLFPLQQNIYHQTLDFADWDDHYQKHTQAVTYLKNIGGIRLDVLTKPVDQYILEAVHSCTKHVRSLFLWPLRGAYWYFIRRRLWHNLTIQQQHEKGKIKLPNEIDQFQI
ncbi:MAG: hypothetical protein ACYSU8_03580 [Planctomycetota bacterium]|jgi:hypothetical protein